MFKIVESKKDYLKNICVRSIVFIDEQKCPYEEELDGLDESAVLIIGEENFQPFACGRIRFIEDFAKLERIALRKEWRKKGLGLKLVNFMVDHSIKCGYKKIKMNAQLYAVPFYERLGFKTMGSVFMEAGIEHKKMELNI